MKRILAVVFLMGIFALGISSPTFADFFDDFNRPDSSDLGPDWAEQNGDFRVESGRARSSLGFGGEDLMTVNGFSSSNPVLSMDVAYDGAPRVSYAALVSLYSDLNNNIFVKVQDNDSTGDFERVFFYYGNNSIVGWPGMTGGGTLDIVAPFQQARIESSIVGDTVTLTIDRDFNGTPETILSRGGIPAVGLGTGVGVGGFDNASLDNFLAVPEPASVMLTGLGLLMGALLFGRKRWAAKY
jgi:hypothetical protein